MSCTDERASFPRGVYYVLRKTAVLLFAAFAVSLPARLAVAEVDVSIEPAMTKGSVTAPVTIIEFSDYQ